MSACSKPPRCVAARWVLLKVSANSTRKLHSVAKDYVLQGSNHISYIEQGMKPANFGVLCCSAETPAEIFDKEHIRCELAAQVLKDSGILRLRASGSSMLPSLWPGDVITIKPQSFEQWRPGDIVLYRRAGTFFIHRVIAVSNSGDFLIVQGDWLPQPDPRSPHRKFSVKPWLSSAMASPCRLRAGPPSPSAFLRARFGIAAFCCAW